MSCTYGRAQKHHDLGTRLISVEFLRHRPFSDAVHAGVANIMCSYNRLNNSYACDNSKLLNGHLKGEMGFQGFVVTDWGAQMSGIASALAGLDVAMPSSILWGANLTNGVNNGSVTESQLDNMVTRYVCWLMRQQWTHF